MNIVIVGAGVAGLATAWRLLEQGCSVTILDRGQPGAGTTAASAGMITVTAEFGDARTAESEFARYSSGLWPDFAKQIESESGISIGYRKNGTLILAEDESALPGLERRGGTMLDVAAARSLAPLLTAPFAGAAWSPDEAEVDTRALAAALIRIVRAKGGKLVANEAVVRIERQGGRATAAHTPFGRYTADQFLLAAGPWSGLIEEQLAPVIPVKGEILVLEPPAGVALPRPMIWGHGVYLVPRGRYLLVGATVEKTGFDTSPTPAARRHLIDAACRIVPDLRNWPVADHWAGLRPLSFDGMPLIGPTSVEGLWLASGQYRNGILFAPGLARSIADQIMGRGLPIAAFDPRRAAA
jgi:glycine oxidase